MSKVYQYLFLIVVLMNSACTWVDLSEQGEKVRVLESDEVAKCKLLGKTTANTKGSLVGVRRHENAINYELTTLARNSAAKMGGDSIVAEGPETDGRQTFLIYQCLMR